MRTFPVVGCMSMLSFDPAGSGWSINVPLSALVALQELPERMKKLEDENMKLRRELEALRNIQGQMMIKLADVSRERRS